MIKNSKNSNEENFTKLDLNALDRFLKEDEKNETWTQNFCFRNFSTKYLKVGHWFVERWELFVQKNKNKTADKDQRECNKLFQVYCFKRYCAHGFFESLIIMLGKEEKNCVFLNFLWPWKLFSLFCVMKSKFGIWFMAATALKFLKRYNSALDILIFPMTYLDTIVIIILCKKKRNRMSLSLS